MEMSTNHSNKSVFHFFSDFRTENKVLFATLETVVLGLLFILSLLANVFAAILVAKGKKLVNKNCFVLNLFFADVLFICMVPIILVVRWTESWILGDAACKILLYFCSISGCVIIASLAAISLERMICIIKLQPTARLDVKFVTGTLISLWVFSAVTSLPLCIFFHVITVTYKDKEVQICTLMWPSTVGEISWDIFYVILEFFIPGIMIVISYSKILQISKAARKRLNDNRSSIESKKIRISQKDYKLFQTLLLLMISFIIMWSPICITIFLILAQQLQPDVQMSSTVFFWVMTFTFGNSILNPVLYNLSHFKKKCLQIFCCCASYPSDGLSDTAMENTSKRIPKEEPRISVIKA